MGIEKWWTQSNGVKNLIVVCAAYGTFCLFDFFTSISFSPFNLVYSFRFYALSLNWEVFFYRFSTTFVLSSLFNSCRFIFIFCLLSAWLKEIWRLNGFLQKIILLPIIPFWMLNVEWRVKKLIETDKTEALNDDDDDWKVKQSKERLNVSYCYFIPFLELKLNKVISPLRLLLFSGLWTIDDQWRYLVLWHISAAVGLYRETDLNSMQRTHPQVVMELIRTNNRHQSAS